MKTEAPEKIYLYPSDLAGIDYDEEWFEFPCGDNNIEYTRTDAFIEKACDSYCKVCGHYAHTVPNHICRQDCNYYTDFRNCIMKGD